MALFGKSEDASVAEIRRREEEALEALREATRSLVEIEAQLSASTDTLEIVQERNKLSEEVNDLEIKKRKIEDDHRREREQGEEAVAREKREIEHKTGLVLEQTEKTVEHAAKEAELKVREESLADAEKRFEEQLEFVEKRFREHTDRLDSIVDKVLESLPNVNAALSIGEPRKEQKAETKSED